MSRTRARRLGRAGACLLLSLLAAEAASAASSVESGWWTTAVTPPPPDVPSDSLLVEATVAPTAFAAVSFQLQGDERPGTLRLTVVEGSASNPVTTLRLCPLTEPIEPAHGGPAEDAPAYDCSTAIDAQPEAGIYVFDVAGLPATGSLAVAVLPTGPLDRAVLQAPEATSLATTPAPATGPTITTSVAAPGPAPTSGGGSITPTPTVRPPSPRPGSAAVAVPQPGTPPAAQPATTGESQTEAPPVLSIGGSAAAATSRLAQATLAAALGLAAVLWIASGALAHNRTKRDRRATQPV